MAGSGGGTKSENYKKRMCADCVDCSQTITSSRVWMPVRFCFQEGIKLQYKCFQNQTFEALIIKFR